MSASAVGLAPCSRGLGALERDDIENAEPLAGSEVDLIAGFTSTAQVALPASDPSSKCRRYVSICSSDRGRTASRRFQRV
jgi:hypothetical protein